MSQEQEWATINHNATKLTKFNVKTKKKHSDKMNQIYQENTKMRHTNKIYCEKQNVAF